MVFVTVGFLRFCIRDTRVDPVNSSRVTSVAFKPQNVLECFLKGLYKNFFYSDNMHVVNVATYRVCFRRRTLPQFFCKKNIDEEAIVF